MTEVCLHCWHSDPDTTKDTRWYCCHCPEECYQNAMDVRHCIGCHMRCLPNPWGFCVMCAEVIDRWLEHQNPGQDHHLSRCIAEYKESIVVENRQMSSRRFMGYRNRHKVRLNA